MSHDPPHSSMFEHSNLVLGINDYSVINHYRTRWVRVDDTGDAVIYGNLRAFMEVLGVKSIDEALGSFLKMACILSVRYDTGHL